MGKTRKKSKAKKYLSADVFAALKANDVSKLKALRESGRSLGLLDRRGNNLLHLAILQYCDEGTSTIEAFEYLLTLNEIDKGNCNKDSCSPLMYAFGHSEDISDYAIKLIEADCEFSMVLQNRETPIHMAVHNDWPDVVELLIEKGVDVDLKNDMMKTALHVAAKFHRTDIIWMLLFYGADPNITYKSEIPDTEDSVAYLTFFDIINKDGALLNQFSNFDKSFSFLTFIDVMEAGSEFFYELMEITCDINYNYGDLERFISRFYLLDPKMFKIFIGEFRYVVEEAIIRCCSDDLFDCRDSRKLESFVENLFTLLQSEVRSVVIEEINKSKMTPLLTMLVQSFMLNVEKIELLTQILCFFASYGATIDPDVMYEIYTNFGYCDLFKILLHMDIGETRTQPVLWYIWPTVIHDIQMDLDYFIYGGDHTEPITYKLISRYFTLPASLRVPSLVELARNASRKCILKRYQPKNSMQYFTILKALPIAEVYKKIISFETPLYLPSSV